MSIIIKGTGSYIPEQIIDESNFLNVEFFGPDNKKIESPNEVIIRKFRTITGIKERRYAQNNQKASDLATFAAQKAIEDAQIDPESLDGIFVAHNYGDIKFGSIQTDCVPNIASRVKHNLGINNPNCVAFDLLFGCPGWIQTVINAKNYILAGEGKRYLTIGAETLSRVVDPFDRDRMIFADGAGAAIIEQGSDNDQTPGILSSANQSFTTEETYYLEFGPSLNLEAEQDTNYIRMHGRKIYEFALTHVPLALKTCLDKTGKSVHDVKKILIHQANAKMDEAIIKRFYELYGIKEYDEIIVPMTIDKLGNSSIATVPTLLDLVLKGQLEDQHIEKGDLVLMASVGAGMSINAIAYQF